MSHVVWVEEMVVEMVRRVNQLYPEEENNENI
jgi:hypothetical protein